MHNVYRLLNNTQGLQGVGGFFFVLTMIASAYRQWRVDPCGIEDLNVELRRLGLRDSLLFNEVNDSGEHDDTSDDGDDTDGHLPELSVDFRDPEGSHFEELLRWVKRKSTRSLSRRAYGFHICFYRS